MAEILTAGRAMGPQVTGEALVATDGFSARYDLDREAGVFSRPGHALYGTSYVGRVLVLDRAKGGVASAWMFNEMVARGKAPAALLMNWSNPVLAQGAALAGLTLADGFATDITEALKTGDLVEIDPSSKTVRLLSRSEEPTR
jgi:predicted aconitase with swiveling domain